MLERPSEGASIWVSFSEDLVYWGQSAVVMTPRGGHWDCHRIGAACPPIEIRQGWLLIYYGEKRTSAGPLVRLGAAVLDRDDPSQVLFLLLLRGGFFLECFFAGNHLTVRNV